MCSEWANFGSASAEPDSTLAVNASSVAISQNTDSTSSGSPPPALPCDLAAWLDEQERLVLVRALGETGFNRTAAAARLGLNLRQMRYHMARLGITAPSGENSADDASG